MDAEICYSDDGTTLISCKNPGSTFEVCDGCRVIGRRAFMYQKSLEHIVLPPSVEILEPFAFSYTSLTDFEAPEHLVSIGDKAFYQRADLRSVQFDAALCSIGDEAFAHTSLSAIELPESLEHLGSGTFVQTPLEHATESGDISIAPGNSSLLIDDEGGLYEYGDEGLVLIELLSGATTCHHVIDGASAIGPNAYTRAKQLEQLELPSGLRSIGKAALRGCTQLRHVTFPESLERIDNEAFSETSLEELYLPAGFSFLGIHALRTGTPHTGSTLGDVRVHPDNQRFFTDSGVLYERSKPGRHFVVLRFGHADRVDILSGTVSIGPDAFARHETIREVDIPASVKCTHPRAFGNLCHVETLRIELAQPELGHAEFDVHFPANETGLAMRDEALAVGEFAPQELARCCDHALLYIQDQHQRGTQLLDRLGLPMFLDVAARERFIALLRQNLVEVCLAFARHGQVDRFEELAEFGVLDAGNIAQAIDAVSTLEDATMTGFLFELKRRRFGTDALDFEL